MDYVASQLVLSLSSRPIPIDRLDQFIERDRTFRPGKESQDHKQRTASIDGSPPAPRPIGFELAAVTVTANRESPGGELPLLRPRNCRWARSSNDGGRRFRIASGNRNAQ